MRLGMGLDAAHNIYPYDPVAGRSPDWSIAPDSNFDPTVMDRTVPVTMAIDFTGLDGLAGGMIFEMGGASFGIYLGFAADGSFLLRSGDGGALPSDKAAVVTAPAGEVHGDGRLVISMQTGTPIRARAWWNGTRVGTETDGTSGSDVWTGTGIGKVLRVSTSTGVPVGTLYDVVVSHASASDLALHEGLWLGD